MGLGIGCGVVFLRRGFVRSACAVVSFGLVLGSRSVLVLVGPRGGGFVCLNVGSRLVLFFSFALGVCFRSALVRRGVCGGFVSPRCWLGVVPRVSHWFWSFCACGGFVSFFFFVRCRVLVDQGQNLEICVVN